MFLLLLNDTALAPKAPNVFFPDYVSVVGSTGTGDFSRDIRFVLDWDDTRKLVLNPSKL